MFPINNDLTIFREKKSFLVGDQANRHLIETKLVDILEDFKLENRDRLFLVEHITVGKLTLLWVRKKETASPKEGILKTLRHRFEKMQMLKTNQKEEPTNWTVTPYDLGGHTSYFNSQKLFTCGSTVFFLAFQR